MSMTSWNSGDNEVDGEAVMKKPDHLIINNPYVVPKYHWRYDA